MTTLTHANGLGLRLPQPEYEVEQTTEGFRILPQGHAATRAPSELLVELRPGPAPTGGFPDSRRAGPHLFHHRIDVDEGGSGGAEHTLRAWAAAGTRIVWVEQTLQAEPPSVPDFGATWRLLDGLTAPSR